MVSRIRLRFVLAVLVFLMTVLGRMSLSVQAQDANVRATATEWASDEPLRKGLPDRLTGVTDGAVSVADLAGDDRPDLVITGTAGDRRGRPSTVLYRNDGDDTFTAIDANIPNVAASATATGDVNGDGDLDLLVAGKTARGRVAALYLGDGASGFTTAGAAFPGVSGGSASFGDVNGDEELDLLLTGRRLSGGAGTPTARLYLGGGDGGFTRARAGLTGVSKSASALGDVNEDGNLDLLITGSNADGVPTTTLYLGNGFGDFNKAGTDFEGLEQGSAALHDLNGDGNLDALITGLNAKKEPSTRLYVGDGAGGFTAKTAGLPDVVDGSVSIGDVDADNHPDLVITGKNSAGTPIAALYLGDEGVRFSEARAELEGVWGSASLMADVDGDRRLDLLVTGENERGEPTANLYFGDGDGSFEEALIE